MSTTTWERIATQFGGTVAGLAAAANGTVFAATPVGVYRSVDGGLSWSQPGVGATVAFADLVAVSPGFARDRTLFVCGVDGLYRSSDGGDTWQTVLVGSRMLSVAVATEATHDGVVVLAGTEADGVLRSEDGGRTWTGANAGLLDLTAMCVAVSPCFDTDRTGFAGTTSGLYRTRNGGRAWRSVDTGLDDPAVQCLAISPGFAEDRLVLAGTEAHGLLRSTDGGATWRQAPGLDAGGIAAVAFGASGRMLAAATETGIALSSDGGEIWRMRTPGSPRQALSLLFVGDALLTGLHRDGIARSADRGATWQAANEGLAARLDTDLVLSPDFARDRTVFVAGPEDGVRVSGDGGLTWEAAFSESASVHGIAVSATYASDRSVYLATSGGLRVSRDAGRSWAVCATGDEPARAVACGPGVILAALEGGRLVTSLDGGRDWQAVAAPLEGADAIALGVSPGYARDRTLFAVTAASGEVVVWRSTDSGQRWQRWLVQPGSGATRVPLVVPSRYGVDQTMFVALGRRVLRPVRDAQEVHAGERRPMWQAAEPGPEVTGVTDLAVSPAYGAGDRTVFAATNAGVFVSRSGGETFEAWSDGLDPARVVSVAVSPAYAEDRLVYALGLGGTLWRRVDVASPAGSGYNRAQRG